MNTQYKNPDFRVRLLEVIGNERPFAWAARVGISKGAFSRVWKEGTIPNVQHLKKIVSKTGYSIDWLLTGVGPKKIEKKISASLSKPTAANYVFLNKINANEGLGGYCENMLFKLDWIKKQFCAKPDSLRILKVESDNMMPVLNPQDTAILDCALDSLLDGIYLIRTESNYSLKRLQGLPNNEIVVSNDNKNYRPAEFEWVNPNKDSIVGRVVWVFRKL